VQNKLFPIPLLARLVCRAQQRWLGRGSLGWLKNADATGIDADGLGMSRAGEDIFEASVKRIPMPSQAKMKQAWLEPSPCSDASVK
jgi:hypothetical protein